MALLAVADLLLVLFDFSYISCRDFYLRNIPSLLALYDPVKGIEPHRETQKYLNTVDRLEQQLAQTGLQAPQVQPLLADLRAQSVAMIQENPFQIANKSGSLEKIKNRMRHHLKDESAKQAFQRFWSSTYLNQTTWKQELSFFDRQIRPLIAANYYRHLGENGQPLEGFWRIDLFFIGIFGIEFLTRTFYLSRRHRGTAWIDTMLWRWYDLFLLLPFWRLLRIIPVTIRLHQVGWLNLERIQAQVNRNLAENIAGEVTELVVVRTIGLAQSSLEGGAIAKWLTQPQRSIKINEINEIQVIAERLIKLTVYRVFPQVQPDLEALLRHSIEDALKQLPLYQNLQNLPGMSSLPPEVAARIAHQFSQGAYDALTHSLEDEVGGEIFSQLTQHFTEALRSELQEKQTLQEIQLLLSDLLEEMKLTFLQGSEAEDVNQTLAEVEQLRQVSSETNRLSPGNFATHARTKLTPSSKSIR
jgi:hypothetical protein